MNFYYMFIIQGEIVKSLLDPKVDFVFKNIFGSQKSPQILISFLNAILKSKYPIVKVNIKNTDLEKHFLDDNLSRLDVKAKTINDEIINIEIQLKNEYNMIKRSLHYWSKMYEKQLNQGDDYSELNRTVCINILNFEYLKNNRFHNLYRLKETETNEELSDVCEIHFIEIPKLKENSDENDLLTAWIEFLKNPESEKVRSLEMNIEEIQEAKNELIRLSNDDEQREIYEIRAKILKDKVLLHNKARLNSIKESKYQEKINMANNVLNDETVALRTKLEIEKIRQIMLYL